MLAVGMLRLFAFTFLVPFLLSSLRGGQQGSTSFEEVATFATGAKKVPLVADDVSGSGFHTLARLAFRRCTFSATHGLQLHIVDQHASD